MTYVRDTSIEAYHKIKDEGLLSRRRLEVYCALFEYGPCTGSELFRKMGIAKGAQSNQNVVTRLGELRDMGVVREVRTRPCSITGMNVIEWDVTDKLPVKFEKARKIPCPHCNGTGYHVSQQARLF